MIDAISPTPTDEEVAAIGAVIALLVNRPIVVSEPIGPNVPAWRFSGRWWARPVAVRRDRPFY